MNYFLTMLAALFMLTVSSTYAVESSKTKETAVHVKKSEAPAKEMHENNADEISSAREGVSSETEEAGDSTEIHSDAWDSDSGSYESDE